MLFKVAVYALVFGGLICLLLVSCQSSLIYHPRAYDAGFRQSYGAVAEPIPYAVDGQGEQVAYLFPKQAEGSPPPRRIWFCFGGNAALGMEWLYTLHGSTRWEDTAFVMIDYPGYGDCAGSPSPDSIRQSYRAAAAKVRERFNLEEADLAERSRVLGHSLGAAAALLCANDLGVKHAVLISPFTSMGDMARRAVGSPLCYLLRHRFDNRAALDAFVAAGGKAEIFHGTRDQVIPASMGDELAKAHPGAAVFHPVEGAGHNDILGGQFAEADVLAAIGRFSQ
ncbi:MAG: alpha/beta hydrolase [Verrucomicrobiales bacterium]